VSFDVIICRHFNIQAIKKLDDATTMMAIIPRIVEGSLLIDTWKSKASYATDTALFSKPTWTKKMKMISYLLNRPITRLHRSAIRLQHDKASRVSIGGMDVPLGQPKVPHLVPSNYLVDNPSKQMLMDLQWMMSKDILAQDMLLVGPPGSGSLYRRRLALSYAELTKREVQVVTISSDTTESDLKQRRELVQSKTSGSAEVIFVDQAPVEAAIEGRLLVLDGLEKAERNVLPTLNNLLENREMHLEDG
jgi:hypothetical protein